MRSSGVAVRGRSSITFYLAIGMNMNPTADAVFNEIFEPLSCVRFPAEPMLSCDLGFVILVVRELRTDECWLSSLRVLHRIADDLS